jgi:hypothetical protein
MGARSITTRERKILIELGLPVAKFAHKIKIQRNKERKNKKRKGRNF